MPLTPGTRLGTYEILGFLGAGGMGEVYRALDTRLGREVALKVLPADVASHADRLARFEREARTVAGLNHPNIVVLYSVEDEDGTRFLTMELVEGRSLDKHVAPGGLPLPRLLDLGIALADALTAAHEKGVVHRDLKPANVMLTRDGRVKVLDFGLAKLAAEGSGLEATPATTMATPLSIAGQVMGTVPYMAPEQVRGEATDARTDLFALGIMLYELATGSRPFTGATSADVSSSILRDVPAPLASVCVDLPGDLDRIVGRCLEKNPRERFQTALDVGNELRQLRKELNSSQGAASRAPTSTPSGMTQGRGARRLRLWAVGGAVVVAALGSGLWFRSRPPKAPRSLLVLPFKNLTGDPGVDYLCEGLASDILSDLVRVPRLNVVSHTTAWSFRQSEKNVTAIAKELGVHAILEGAIQRHGDMLRLDAQLVDGRNGFVTWTGRFERASDELIRLEQDVVRDVARTMSGRPLAIEASQVARAPTRSPPAYDAYLHAGRYLDLTDDAMGPDRAAELYAQAITLDPEFALAHAGRSKALFLIYRRTKDPEQFRQAEDASNRAIQLNPGLLEARLARAQMYRAAGRYPESIAELGAILNINPNWDEAQRHLAASYRAAGDLTRAEASARAAAELRPSYAKNWDFLGAILTQKGDYVGARAAFEQVVKLAPELNIGYEHLASVATLEGKYDEAIAAYDRLPAPAMDGPLASNIGTAHFFARHLDQAEKFYLLAVRLEPRNATWRQNLGDLYVRQGKPGPARDEFRQAARLVEEQLALNPDDFELGLERAGCLAKAGDCEAAEQSLATMMPKLQLSNAQNAHSIARIHALCGRRGEAVAAVRRALELGFSPRLMRDEDEFRSLASDSEFVGLVAGESPKKGTSPKARP